MASLKLISATDTQYSARVLKSMNEQRNPGLFCDITITIKEQKFRAHKTILSASSTYFNQLFSVAVEVVELNIIRAEIFEIILEYIYSSKLVRVRSDLLEELISAGKILGVKFIANLGVPLSQVKGLPGLSKDSAGKNDVGLTRMPIITESFSLSTEEFNQTDKSADKEEDVDSDDVLFVSETDAQTRAAQKSKLSEIIDLDEPDSEDDQDKNLKAFPADIDASPLIHSSPSSCGAQSLSSAKTQTTQTSSSIPEPHSTSLPSENHEILGVQKKQVHKADFKTRLLNTKTPGSAINEMGLTINEMGLTINEMGLNVPKSVVAAKKTISLDKEPETNSLSTGYEVYANGGGKTYNFVPMKEEQGEMGSKGRKDERCPMSTPLKVARVTPPPQGSPINKKARTEKGEHYEIIMDGKTFFVCIVCKHPYVCLRSLKRHFNTHSWEKRYPCHYCNKEFAMAEYRTKHEAKHTGLRRYQCLLCNDMFINYKVLQAHCKKAHNEDISGSKKRDDANNNLYRLIPYKTLLQKSDVPADPNGIPIIDEEGMVHHINPSSGHLADQGLQTPTQGTVSNWHDSFVEPGAPTLPGIDAQPESHDSPPPGSSEFEFVIPETY